MVHVANIMMTHTTRCLPAAIVGPAAEATTLEIPLDVVNNKGLEVFKGCPMRPLPTRRRGSGLLIEQYPNCHESAHPPSPLS